MASVPRDRKAELLRVLDRPEIPLHTNTLRHGMDYADPGASYYEERYRQRVLANLKRRAKALGYALQQISPEVAVS